MARTIDELLPEALELAPEERGRLAEELLVSLRTTREREIAAEWTALAERRFAEIQNGTARTVSLEDAMEHARQALNDASARTARRG